VATAPGEIPADADFEHAGLLENVDGQEQRAARLELLRRLSAAGVTLEELQRAVAEDRLSMLPVELEFARGRYTLAQAVELTRLDREFIVRDLLALGLPRPGDDDLVLTDRDIAALRMVKQTMDAGVSEENTLELARIFGHGAAQTAQALLEIFTQAFLRAGDTERDFGMRVADVAAALRPFLGPLLEMPVELHLREAVRHEVVGRAERASGRLRDSREVTVCFADLVGFTRLGEDTSVEQLGRLARRFADIAAEAAQPPVKLVKMIGDAAMLVSPDPVALVKAAIDITQRVAAEPELPPLHVGVAGGAALARAGDWYGRPVNLASRITAMAPSGAVLSTRAVRESVGDAVRWSPVGEFSLKGIEGPIQLFRAIAESP
jgi:adenylate cyclase